MVRKRVNAAGVGTATTYRMGRRGETAARKVLRSTIGETGSEFVLLIAIRRLDDIKRLQ
jgi:hypothetical protein